MTEKLILLCAGGTGGHVFPARALAEELLARGYRVAFATDARGMKYLEGMENVHIISAGPYRAGLRGKVTFVLSLIKGYIQAHRLISRLKPSVAVGFGGYPCAPPMFACQHRFIPTILHEQNAVLGLALKLLAPLAKNIALSFPLKSKIKNTIVTGNPVRADIMALRDKEFPKIENELNVLIFGGSLGATSFAEIIPHSIIRLAGDLKVKLKIVHQARESDLEKVTRLYSNAGLDVEIKPFFDNIPERIEIAHLMICRAGASTVAETTCAGRPAIYIPYPWHKDQQQLHNAQHVAEVGGGWIMEEKNLTPDSLYQLLKKIVPEKLPEAAAYARSLGQPDATGRLADQVIKAICFT
ncbi:MAG: undecaprenyldiphospho-muramoylpentapeptide beta-N-acetylglucosaminyltransferase [Micavibrio aeruginosavorus]|uniref:UDP-N-acetylglucosamine--N-acetylmuramyl-(pentapeptide) pyrophosphoryl-undecaprenol N-acetylglucosamine transferase n=1 Tax=Micavibrio aeruginosavorus TaxID=349221 RepID=A0A2W5HKJ1_9BACT|nr:MAG: undecaprenyldiphospho-muramoylpentapeptide beta-N-acetylglucosaminyltransferase [Micavibrio aeruginosavorus]